MPSSPLAFRTACGHFVQVFAGFKTAGAEVRADITTLKVHDCMVGVMAVLFPLLFSLEKLLYLCGDVELNPGPPKTRQTKLTGRKQSETTDSASAQPDVPTTPSTEPNIKDMWDMIKSMLNDSGEARSHLTKALETTATAAQDDSQPEEPPSGDPTTLLQDVNRKFDDIKASLLQLTNTCAGIQQDIMSLNKKVVDLKMENEEIREENSELKRRVDLLEKRTDDLESRMKKNNLVFHGINKKKTETGRQCEEIVHDVIRDKMEITEDVKFDSVRRVSNKPDSPIIACLSTFRHKGQILKARNLLKGTNIFVTEDYPLRIREIRKKLVPYLREARKSGKRVTMIYDHLLIDGVKMFLCEDGLAPDRNN